MTFIKNNNLYTLKTKIYNCQCNNVGKEPTTMDGYGNMSTTMIRANRIYNNVGIGGKIAFGNYNFGRNTNTNITPNYLGRVEGQNGGSGRPLRNRF
jgi:hypothetical protein